MYTRQKYVYHVERSELVPRRAKYGSRYETGAHKEEKETEIGCAKKIFCRSK
jgi:hypothetical protein